MVHGVNLNSLSLYVLAVPVTGTLSPPLLPACTDMVYSSYG